MQFAVSVIVVMLSLGFNLCIPGKVRGSFPKVTTPLGKIEGYYKTSTNGRRYEAYEGIPYAHPPTGKLRFEIAKSISPWKGVMMAKQFRSACIQTRTLSSEPTTRGSEDCLYINVYTPRGRCGYHNMEITLNTSLPVIFFIHGGAFRWCSGSEYGPKYLLDEEVIVVTFNYRLGALGFLSTEDDIVPGNMGLKDQVVALRWVKDNIQSFCGDPLRITMFGQSAGSTSVHYHYLSKLTKGLFRGGISLSGTALECWAETEGSLEKAKKLAAIVGCSTDNVRRMVDCLKDQPADQIVLTIQQFTPWMINPGVPFGPVVENPSGDFTFIDRSPIDILTSGDAHDLPWITGSVSEEGLVLAAAYINAESILKEMNSDWEKIAPHLLDYNYTLPKSDHPRVSRLIKQHYLGKSPFSKTSSKQIVQMIGDRLFGHNSGKAAKLQARANESPVRFYHFSYRGAHSFSEIISGSNENFGVAHHDDLAYIFETSVKTTTTPKDRAMQKKLIKLWVSFATTGEIGTSVEWPAVNRHKEKLNYLHIAGPKELSIKTSENFGQRHFWESIGFQENKIIRRN